MLLAAAALAATVLSLDVPYVPQTEVLCGGASAAMVFRYWGDAHADAGQFASIVDRRRGGIETSALVTAVAARGWRASQFTGSIDVLRDELTAKHPMVVLVADRGNLYHYVVVVGMTPDHVVVHDPSWGPSRAIDLATFDRIWKAARYWTLLVTPGDRAIAEGSRQAFGKGNEPITANSEMAGVRFAEKRWREAAGLAEEAVRRDPADAYAWDVLASSRFMLDDTAAAIRAWNQIQRPRLDVVRVQGLSRTRYQSIIEYLGIGDGSGVIDARRFEVADRRAAELPDSTGSRVSLRPGDDGYATVDVAIAERQALPRSPADWGVVTLRAAVDREVAVSVPNGGGDGALWTGAWRWWDGLPRVSVAFALPRGGRLGGIWRASGSWEDLRFSDGVSADVQQSHLHSALSASDWLAASFKYTWTAGLDRWTTSGVDRKAVSVGGSIEHRAWRDRLSLVGSGTKWFAVDGTEPFGDFRTRAVLQSSRDHDGWVLVTAAGAEWVSDAAPVSIWPLAGEGRLSDSLLRAHPLVADGHIQIDQSHALGRTLLYQTIEAQRWLPSASPVRFGAAGFVDLARSARGAGRDTSAQIDLGAGLRVHIPGTHGSLRVDVATGLRDGARAVTAAWQFW